jgi:hypothetical protein
VANGQGFFFRISFHNLTYLFTYSYNDYFLRGIGLAFAVLSSYALEELGMNSMTRIRWTMATGLLVGAVALPGLLSAQEVQDQAPPVISRDIQLKGDEPKTEPRTVEPQTEEPQQTTAVPYPTHVADGQRHGLPAEAYAVVPGTKFLVTLEQPMCTKDLKRNQEFRVRTAEPLEAGRGIFLPAGAEIRGHISRVESAGQAGRAKLWLTFDEIRTRFGNLPIVAEVAGMPGDHSISSNPVANGVIQGNAVAQKDAMQAAATGAAKGAVKGVKDKDKKEAAQGALMGAVEAYLLESGRGQDLDLPKGAKLELELERSLYLVRE